MNEPDIFPVQPYNVGLDKIQAVAGEHFKSYLLVVMDDKGQTWRAFNNKCTAHGMASMVVQDINRDWYQGK